MTLNAVRYELLARWEPRPESAEACAAHLARALTGLARIDPTFETWIKARPRGRPPVPLCAIPPNLDELTRFIERGRHYQDLRDAFGQKILVPQLGFSTGAGNEFRHEYLAYFSMGCGGYFDHILPNRFDLTFTNKLGSGRPWRGRELEPVVMAVARAWNIKYAVVTTSKFSPFIALDAKGNGYRWPWAGWLTYLAPPDSLKITPPPSVFATRFPDGGLLTTLCDETFDPDNVDHLRLAADMQRALEPVLWE